MAELKGAKANKRSLKSRITKFENKINSTIDNADISLLELYESKTLDFGKELGNIFDSLFIYCEDKDVDDFIEEKEKVQDNLDEIHLKIKRRISTFNCKDIVISDIKLPKLSLPTFGGKFEEWIEFEDLFSAAVHNNSKLTNAQKLQYLKSSCKSDALNIIYSIPISDANYDIAWNLLVERYSNKKNLITCVIKKLLSIPQTCDSAPSLLKFVDNVNECIRSLKALDQKVEEFSDTLIVYLLVEKLDRNTRCWWERSLKKDEIGTIEQLISFLKEQSRTLLHNKNPQRESRRFINSKTLTSLSENTNSCVYCKGDHILMKCEQFLNLSVKKRFEFVKARRLCSNCLSSFHTSRNCNSLNRCKKCQKFHNSLLHFERKEENLEGVVNNSSNRNATNPIKSSSDLSPRADIFTPLTDCQLTVSASDSKHATSVSSTALNLSTSLSKQVLLSTAIIYVKGANGTFIPLRALLDSGSQDNFITKECMELLNLKRKKINASVSGINGTVMSIKENTLATIANASRSFIHTLQFFVVPKITRITPARYLPVPNLKELHLIDLADPEFYKPGPIHILLSNEIFFELLGVNKIRMQDLIFQQSVFGYIVSGSVRTPQQRSSVNYCCLVKSVDNLTDIMKRFWEIESVQDPGKMKSQEEIFCEEHFRRTHFRQADGRYVVEMPIKEEGLGLLGKSKENANKRLNYLLKRFVRNPAMKTLYEDFIQEYNRLGHSEEIKGDNSTFSHYLPHHGIFRPNKPSTKLRVVFDASAATDSGVSLNNILLNGGTVQDELFDIICRFRLHKFVFTADIVKMYRQILIKDHQRDLLRILWKNSEEEPTKIYRLKTITYGTSNAPYLATRTLNQLADDEKGNFPIAAQVVQRDFYVDDVLTGAHTLREAQKLQSQLIQLLSRGGMTLHRWCANHQNLLQRTGREPEYSFNSSDVDQGVKTLGLLWNPKADCFSFKTSVKKLTTYTKRTVLSDIARIYDPLGLLGPGITKAKIFIQRLWLLKLEWDDPLPENVLAEWKLFVTSMQAINRLLVDRFVLQDNLSEIQIHGFSDASEHAYGAAIYLLCKNGSGSSVKLLCSKSRVAPLKPLTVPRLELCAAVLLSQLVSKVMTLLNLNISKVFLWCDSTIVLAWLQNPPHLLKTFVANRVLKVQELTSTYQWNHVSSEENPADFVSRGLNFDKLLDADLWWRGPSFLKENCISNKNIDFQQVEKTEGFSNELRKTVNFTFVSTDSSSWIESILNITNNYIKLLRIVSYILRFIWNARNPSQKRKGWLTSAELGKAEIYLVRETQKMNLCVDYNTLAQGKSLNNKSHLLSLHPFLDENKVLRVGGRLQKANMSFSAKHQIILPAKCKLSKIIAEYYHKKYLHAGPQALLCSMRQKFWPLQGRNLTRKITHECINCSKNKPITVEQIMGSLPAERVNPGAPFNYVGVDFGGPFFIIYKGQRKGILHKVYLAIFICFIIKAVHLELVSDLTTAAFIATLKRFVSRRGKCAVIFSDNAKNFVGANAELQKINDLIRRPDEKLANYFAEEGIKWEFIPPRSPHFGGLWEAGIKSVKYHLKRTVGNARLTFEELLTVVNQIESVLNSRPITPMSSDVNDLEALTPSHFLIGRPMTAIEEPELININDNRLSKWKKITKWVQIIWKRWQREYLNTLQQRFKWQSDRTNIKIGMLVLVKEEDLPINRWLLGRIVNVVFGSDNKVRVVEIKTARGILKRNITKIAILPQKDN